ncbi:MAG: type II CRISPR RNA-guided endonuclease Cas9, partial [Alphaproteobacteria bacterium]|nr:type II CRISPR RNA-guided endonuclease Cas9 [Alphaproteobacteria bacterium]
KGGTDKNDTEGQKVLTGAVELEEKWLRSGEKSIAAYLSMQAKQRNGDGDYTNSIKRDLIREEVKQIFAAQKKFGNIKATPELLKEYAGSGNKEERNTLEGDGIAFFQRPLQSSEHLVGECTFEEGEKRAPRQSYTAELFVLWTKINNARIKDTKGNERALDQDEKNKLSELAHKNKGGVTYKQARKELGLCDGERFNISYRKIKEEDNSWSKIRDTSEKRYFLKLTGYHALKEALHTGSDSDWQNWLGSRIDSLDDIARILSFYEDKKQVDEMLSKHGLSEEQKEKLCNIKSFSKSVDLSLKALRKIVPLMQTGMKYDEACKEVYGDHRAQKENKVLGLIPPFDDIRNPVVNRALAQTRKVINACLRKYCKESGMPETIIVEMAREVGKNFKDRKETDREQQKNEAYRNEARAHAAEILGIIEDNVTGTDILKYRLWKEQDGFCPYSGVYMTPEILREGSATQIDHIIPRSRSFNNSYMNKVLCLSDENQNKGNETPVEYFTRIGRNISSLENFARQLPHKKAENLLIENYDSRKSDEWKSRALNDTRYIARLLKSHLEENLDVKIQVRNGALTANLRGQWGFGKKTRSNDRHHALDAIVIACSTQSMVQRLSSWNKYNARHKKPSERPMPPKPWDSFRDDALDSVNNIFVSRMPVRKITGSAHQDTIRSIRKSDGKIIQRIKLKSLTLAKLEDMVDKERNIKLYNVLKERLEEHGGKADKAFAQAIYMPVNDPTKTAPQIKSIRIVTNEKSGIEINDGLVSNGDMVRVDVFKKKGKYFLVPIYVHHFVKNKLPNKAIMQGKDEKDWEEMDDKDFIFSLCKNELLKIKSKKEEYWGYYNSTNRAIGGINIKAHDNDPDFGKKGMKESVGVKNLLSFEKYSVDYFGNQSRIKKEKRLGVAQCDDSKPSKAQLETGAAAS